MLCSPYLTRYVRSLTEAQLDHISRRFAMDCDVESMTGEKGKYCGTHVDENGNVFIMVTKEAGGKPVKELPGWWQRNLL